MGDFKETEFHGIGEAPDDPLASSVTTISNSDEKSLEESIRIARAIKESESNAEVPYPCGLTRKQIMQMKHAGMPKPDFVSWPEWVGPKKVNHRLRLVAELAARGYKAKEIQAVTGFSTSYLSIALNSPAVLTEIKLIREIEFAGLGVADQIDRLSSNAIRTMEEILTNPGTKDSVRIRAAQDILDRKMGRAKQQVEVRSNIIGDFYKLLQNYGQRQLEAAPANGKESSTEIETTATEVSPENLMPEIPATEILKDGMDAWLDKEFSS